MQVFELRTEIVAFLSERKGQPRKNGSNTNSNYTLILRVLATVYKA